MLLLPIWATACDMNQTSEGYENARIEHVYQHWSQGDQSSIPFVFLDVRTPAEFADGHIPGAVNIPLAELQGRIKEVPADKRLYVYCRSGGRSTKASKLLVKNGYTQVENFKASMNGWESAGYPVEK
jgi:phage shock protein E